MPKTQYETLVHGEFQARPFWRVGMIAAVGWRVSAPSWLPGWSEVVPTREDAIKMMRVLNDEYEYPQEEE